MTDEEREKLCKRLRSTWSTVQEQVKAAEEIKRLAARVKSLETVAELNLQEGERLAAENDEIKHLANLAQPDAEPVAWRWRNKGTSTWQYVEPDVGLPDPVPTRHLEVEPLYTVPPRPDASAGLIEAAAKKQYELDSENSEAVPTWEYIRPVYILHAKEVLKAAFAADRSGK